MATRRLGTTSKGRGGRSRFGGLAPSGSHFSELREEIKRHAASIQARRGEEFEISSSGQTVLLGGSRGAREHRVRAPESYSEGRPTQRFRVGSRVVLSPDALENYGARWRDQVLVVTHVSTAYMPSNQFYSRGQPKGYHPGYDPESGGALYDFKVEGTGQEGTMSVYDWELESAPAKAPQRRSARSTRRR